MNMDKYYDFPPDLEAAAARGRAFPWMTPRFYSFREARDIIGCSSSTLSNYSTDSVLPPFWAGDQNHFPTSRHR